MAAFRLFEGRLTNMEGYIRVENGNINVSYYTDHEKLLLKQNFENLAEKLISEGINPRISWLFDFILDLGFK